MKTKFFDFFIFFVMAAFLFAACGQEAEESKIGETVAEKPTPEKVEPAQQLAGKRIAILIAEGFHDGETLEPKSFLEERGAEVVILGPEPGEVKAYNSEQMVTIEKAVSEAQVESFDALILPGGKGPAVLKEHEAAVNFAGEFLESGKPVAAVCHGPQVLIAAGVIEDRTLTCTSSVAEEIQAAGGEYQDKPVVIDGNLITSRGPGDLPAFNEAILNALIE